MNTRISIKYGAISGLAIVSSWFITYFIWGAQDQFSGGEVFGYGVMLVAFTAVFMGIKNARDNSGENGFSFKRGFGLGLGIVLVASLIYVIGWMIYMPNFAPDFADKYEFAQIELVKESDADETEKLKKIEEIKESVANYKKPHIMMAMTFMEIFPIGLLVSIVCSLILRKKPE